MVTMRVIKLKTRNPKTLTMKELEEVAKASRAGGTIRSRALKEINIRRSGKSRL